MYGMTEDRPIDKGRNGSWGEVFMLSLNTVALYIAETIFY
jgi:hypothetical protein